jgi:predicted component of type VI protein secretion system
MSDQLLGILKIALLALLYIFFARVLWAVWSEVRGPRPGRSANATISVPDDTFVSQLHARVFSTGQETWLEDLGSTNGTFLNGGRLGRPELLRKGDRLQIGSTVWEAH